LATQTDAAGRTTTYAYDELNRNVQTTLAGGATTRSIYSAGGRISATIDANGNRTDYAYDAAGRPTTTTLPAVIDGIGGPATRAQVRKTLNALGAPTATIDPLGRSTAYTYDANGRPVKVTYPDGTFATQTFDVLGHRTGVTNEEGQTTNYAYDGLGRLVSVSGHAGDATFAYDEAGNLVTQTDALGRITRIRYDALNRPVERQYPGGEAESYVYDAVGNLVAMTDPNGKTTTFVYDARNRMTRKNLPGGAGIDYAYAADGRRTTVTDARGVTSYSYDSAGRLAGVTHPSGATVGYTRDASGNLLALSSPAATTTYGYDALNRIVKVTAPEGAAQYFYDLAGNAVRRTAGNGIVTDYTFDTRNRPTLLAHKTAGNSALQSFANSWSPAGRRTQVVEQDGSTESFGYDARGRLSSETRTGSNPFAISHAYNAVGNRTQTTKGGVPTTFSYDNNDRLLGDGTASYAYDANGNLVTRSAGSAVTQFGYDPQNRLVSVLGPGVANQYAYDADGNRVLASDALGTTRFLVAGANNTGLAQVLEERDGNGNLEARYSYGDSLLAMARAGNASFVHPDVHGSTRLLTNGAGAVTDRYAFDAYGNAAGGSGSTVNPYRYSGQRLDADTGLYQMRARYYDPAAARFTSRDPLGGRPGSPASLHRYMYADADPVNNADPTGMESLPSLMVAQFLSNTLDAAITLSVQGNSVCNIFTAASVAGKAVFWGGLASSALFAFASSTGAPIKTAVSIWGINPLAIQGEDISAIEIRLEVPWTLAISASLANKSTRKISIGPNGFFGSAATPVLSDNIYKCGVPIGSVALKAGVKAGTNPFGGTGSATATLVAELVAFTVVRFEFPILELGFQLKDGRNDLVDKAFGLDLRGRDKGVVQSGSYQ
ncbi:MAG: RHS repeat-associated core domain-containing protein, partial [Betaproteobacteria bacterium]